MLQIYKTNNKKYDSYIMTHSNPLFSTSSWKEVYRGEKAYYRASKLSEGSLYRFRISAWNESGDGYFSPSIEIKTLRANPPHIKTAPQVRLENKDAIASWSQPLQGTTRLY